MSKHIHIAVTTDDNYMHYVAITIASVCYNTSAFCEFFILSDNVSDFKKKQVNELLNKFTNLKINWIDLTKEHKQYIAKTYLAENNNNLYTANLANYSRFLLPDLLPKLDKLLYIDTDIICRGDIAELYNQDLDGHVIGAVANSLVMLDSATRKLIHKYIDKNHLYFNAGVLLIDCKRWRKNDISNKITKAYNEIRDVKIYNTQDPLNKCFENNYKWLDHRFNWARKFKGGAYETPEIKEYIERNIADSRIVIRHFPGKKPNQNPDMYDSSSVADFWFFASMTPFYPQMQHRELLRLYSMRPEKIIWVKLFNCIPLLKIKRGNIYLFGVIKCIAIR